MLQQNLYVGPMEHVELVKLIPMDLVVMVRALVKPPERWEHVLTMQAPCFVVLMVRATVQETVHKMCFITAYYSL